MKSKGHLSTPQRSITFQTLVSLCGLVLFVSCSLWACQPFNEPTLIPVISPGASPTTVVLTSPTPTPLPPVSTASPTPVVEFIETSVVEPVETCTSTSGSLETGVIETKLLDKPMRFNVYLPPCYAAETEKYYPVLYLLHGQNFNEGQWIRIGATETADRLISAGELPPFIIVMPYDYSYKQPSEYKYEQVFIEMLLPRIDLAYRTLLGPANRAVGGLSRGGAWAIHFGLRHPDLFGAVGAHSPAIFYSDMTTLRLRLSQADQENFPRIYIDVGEHDAEYESAQSFARLLNEMNLPHEWHEYIGYHEEKYWSAHVEEYLRWYVEAWK